MVLTQLFLHLFFFLNIKKQHTKSIIYIHVDIQNMKKFRHIFNRNKNYGALIGVRFYEKYTKM
jgi:hypothetical protein